jgi:hypothetical protein
MTSIYSAFSNFIYQGISPMVTIKWDMPKIISTTAIHAFTICQNAEYSAHGCEKIMWPLNEGPKATGNLLNELIIARSLEI